MLRVQIALNDGKAKPQAKRILMVADASPTYSHLKELVKQKMAFKRLPRLFHCDGSEWADGASVLFNGVMLVADEQGKEFRGSRAAGRSHVNCVDPPRSAAFAAREKPCTATARAEVQAEHAHHDTCTFCDHAGDVPPTELHGRFAVLSGDVRPLMQRMCKLYSFVTTSTPITGYTAFDYQDDAVFPPYSPTPEVAALYECRGLWVCDRSGHVVTRRLHKFFEDTPAFDAREPVAFFRKYDGTLVTPVLLCDRVTVLWASRTYVIEYRNPELEAALMPALLAGLTPVFEFCTPTCPVGVLVYDTFQMILLALRDMSTGQYVALDAPVVRDVAVARAEQLPGVDPDGASGVEGVVAVYADGDMVKVKTKWYKDVVRSRQMKDPVKYMASRGHTTLPTVMQYVDETDPRARQLLSDLHAWREYAMRRGLTPREADDKLKAAWGASQFTLVTLVAVLNGFVRRGERAFVQTLLDGDTHLRFPGVYDSARCPADVRRHVLEQYLPRKLSKLGDGEDGAICVPYGYAPSEGKIFGMHEDVAARHGLVDLRVDLQPAMPVASPHNGDAGHALLLVQCEVEHRRPLSLAGVFLAVNVPHTRAAVRDAMERSFDLNGPVSLSTEAVSCDGGGGGGDGGDGSSGHASSWRVFCDLDGVLVSKAAHKDTTVVNFAALPEAEDAQVVWRAVQELARPGVPTILTAVYTEDRDKKCRKREIAAQKKQWVSDHLGPDVEVITCDVGRKHEYAAPDAVLVDDNNHPKWEAAGGTLVRHVTPRRTVFELQALLEPTWWKTRVARDGPPVLLSPTPIIWVPAGQEPADTAALEGLVAVGLDVEWQFASTSGAATVQLATPTVVFVADALCGVPPWVARVLDDEAIVKVCYNFELADLARLQHDVANAFDVYMDVMPKTGVGLAEACALLTGVTMCKNKAVTLSDWAARPLTEEQLEYAAMDARALLAMHDVLGRPPGKHYKFRATGTQQQAAGALDASCNDLKPGSACSVEFWGYVLEPSSAQALRQSVPPVHLCRGADCYDHVTVPAPLTLTGSTVEMAVTGVAVTNDVQAVRVGNFGHVTLSYAPHATAHAAHAISIWSDVVGALTLFTRPCAFVRSHASPLASLPEAVQRKIDRFKRCDADKVLQFQASDLTSAQRALVHEYAVRTGFRSESTGVEPHRRLTLTKTKSMRPKPGLAKYDRLFEERVHRVFDDGLLRSLDLHQTFAAEVDDGGVLVPALADLTPRTVVVLRGVPGIGKSTVARALVGDRAGAGGSSAGAVFSADDFLVDRDFPAAHAACLSALTQHLAGHDDGIVVVDTTASRRWMYGAYLSAAEAAGRPTLVVELGCPSLHLALDFARRSVHSVPHDSVMAMYAHWEQDPSAVLVKPYHSEVSATGGGPAVTSWLKQARIPLTPCPTPSTTHMLLGIGLEPSVRFFGVPPRLVSEFLDVFAQDPTTRPVAEVIQKEPFAYFADIDALGTSGATWTDVGTFLSTLLSDVIVLVPCPDSQRAHVHASTLVTRAEAIRIGEQLQAAGLVAEVDLEVYGPTGGLRLPGSSKNSNCAAPRKHAEYVSVVYTTCGPGSDTSSLRGVLQCTRINRGSAM